jgi:hypothetical protein
MVHHTSSEIKSILVDLGLACLAQGYWRTVRIITQIIQEGGMRDA